MKSRVAYRRGGARAAGLGVVLASGLAAPALADFSYGGFGSTQGLRLLGHATTANGVLRITDSIPIQTGGVWVTEKQAVGDGFIMGFTFQMLNRAGNPDPAGDGGADGFAFVIQNNGDGALEDTPIGRGGGLGYNGMSNAFVIEFDTWKNTRAADPDGNHISVHANGTDPVSSGEWHSIGMATGLPSLSDGLTHTVVMVYLPGSLSLMIDNIPGPVLNVETDIGRTLALGDGTAWVGFTGTTYGAWETHDILNWAYTAIPTPGSAALLAAGGLVAVRRRRR